MAWSIITKALAIGGLAGMSPGTVQAAAPDLSCPKLRGVDAVLAAHRRFIVVGEIHGTNEAPALVGDLVCNIATKDDVTVILEFSIDESDRFQKYIESRGSEEDKAALLESYIWDPDFADGRASKALLSLIEYLRELKGKGANLHIRGSIPALRLSGDQHYYDLGMAFGWTQAAAQYPDGPVVILTGRFHAGLVKEVDGPGPAASFIQPQDLLVIRPKDEGGSAYYAVGLSASVHSLGNGTRFVRGIDIHASPGAIEGVYSVGKPYTASLPAKQAQ